MLKSAKLDSPSTGACGAIWGSFLSPSLEMEPSSSFADSDSYNKNQMIFTCAENCSRIQWILEKEENLYQHEGNINLGSIHTFGNNNHPT